VLVWWDTKDRTNSKSEARNSKRDEAPNPKLQITNKHINIKEESFGSFRGSFVFCFLLFCFFDAYLVLAI